MERASSEAISGPDLRAVSAIVASATEGAPPKMPAKRFGRTTSPRKANRLTIAPPRRKRHRRSIHTQVTRARRLAVSALLIRSALDLRGAALVLYSAHTRER